ncbi:hypothetical protein HZS_6117 [Henneguya salminicola]|nr:hypothetical protein HZS_6117 [Henneguya salminicola]
MLEMIYISWKCKNCNLFICAVAKKISVLTVSKMVVNISKKKLFIKNGLLFAELNCFFQRSLAEEGYVGLEIRPRGTNTDIVLMVTRPQNIVGEKGRKIRELTALVQRKFNYEPDKIRIYVNPIKIRNLSAPAQCETLKYKLSHGIAVRKACYTLVRSIMEAGARGCEVVVSGKIRGQRAKSMKFVDGVMIHAGHPVIDHVDFATRCVLLKQGVLGIKVKIHKPIDTTGQQIGAPLTLPDHVVVHDPKDEMQNNEPRILDHKPKPSPEERERERLPAQRQGYSFRETSRHPGVADLSQTMENNFSIH